MSYVEKGTKKEDASFETRIFGKRAMTLKKRTKTIERKKEEVQKRKEEAEKKLREDEERKAQEEEDKANEADEESDHHGRMFIDYREPRPSSFPQAYTFSSQVKCGHGTFATVYMSTLEKSGLVVAVKKLKQDKKYKSRELQIHKEMHHQNIVRIQHAFFSE